MKNKRTTTGGWCSLFLFLLSGTLYSAEPGLDKNWTLARRLYADPRARHVGDILTVIIEEKSEAAKDAKSSSGKKSAIAGEISVGHPQIDMRPTAWTNVAMPSWKLDTSHSFEGSGSSANKDKFTTTMSVTVRDVLPNGNLLVEGSRSVNIRGDVVNMILSGTVRSQDIDRSNIVRSSQIADAAVRYETSGTLARNTEKGLVTKMLDWINPF